MITKNYIQFRNKFNRGNFQMNPLLGDTRLHVFDRALMNTYLDQFTPLDVPDNTPPICYDDITEICIDENRQDQITDLPRSLERLQVLHSHCVGLNLTNCVNTIRYLFVNCSNLESLPIGLSQCSVLSTVKLNFGNISDINVDQFPKTLTELNLSNNTFADRDSEHRQTIVRVCSCMHGHVKPDSV